MYNITTTKFSIWDKVNLGHHENRLKKYIFYEWFFNLISKKNIVQTSLIGTKHFISKWKTHLNDQNVIWTAWNNHSNMNYMWLNKVWRVNGRNLEINWYTIWTDPLTFERYFWRRIFLSLLVQPVQTPSFSFEW